MAITPFRVKALFDYSSKEEDDLTFPSGQVILVTDEEDADWYYGEYEDSAGNKQEGLFPRNFVKSFEPDMPPRPARSSRSKKDNEAPVLPNEEASVPAIEEPGVLPATQRTIIPEHTFEEPEPPTTQAVKTETPFTLTQKPPPATALKPAPPPAEEKVTTGSFRDRINAFNKSTAPPPAPNKPSGLAVSGGSGFVKKAFVAPPPSKNAYVPPPRDLPPQKLYRREEDPEITSTASDVVENGVQVAQPLASTPVEIEEDQPKPTSLKDRIALLQKQQREQAARHVEGSQKKEKPKRPSKKQDFQESAADADNDEEGGHLQKQNDTEITGNRSIEASRDAGSSGARYVKSPNSQEATPMGSPTAVTSQGFMSDPNDADQSGTADTEDGEGFSTGWDDSDGNRRHKPSIPPQIPHQASLREVDNGGEEDKAEDDDAEDEEDEDVDPEVRRRMEIRERMAKMSGGMGMAGMFGPPGGIAPRGPTKRGTASTDRNGSGSSVSAHADDGSSSRVPPVPIMPIAGLQRVLSPEQHSEEPQVVQEEASVPKYVIQAREPEDMPDVEDVVEEPTSTPRKSVERPPPPPVLQGKLLRIDLIILSILTSSRSPRSPPTRQSPRGSTSFAHRASGPASTQRM